MNNIDDFDMQMFTKSSAINRKETRQTVKQNIVGEKTRLNVRKFYFSQRVISDWNKLPVHVQNAKSLSLFKSQLHNII